MAFSLESKDFRNIHQVRDERHNAIQKGLYGDIEKGGVGSGRTRSGKKIDKEASSINPMYSNFTKEDHQDAINYHRGLADKSVSSLKRRHHGDIVSSHMRARDSFK